MDPAKKDSLGISKEPAADRMGPVRRRLLDVWPWNKEDLFSLLIKHFSFFLRSDALLCSLQKRPPHSPCSQAEHCICSPAFHRFPRTQSPHHSRHDVTVRDTLPNDPHGAPPRRQSLVAWGQPRKPIVSHVFFAGQRERICNCTKLQCTFLDPEPGVGGCRACR